MILDDPQYQLLELPIDVASPGREPISTSIQEQVDYQKRGALVSIRKTVISRQRLRQRRNLTMDRAVIPREGPPDRRFDKTPVAHSGQSAETKRLLVRFDHILNSDAIVPYGGSALRQALERIRGARRGVADPRRRALRSERAGLGVPMNGRTRAARRSHGERFFAARVPDRPVVTLLRCSIRHGESIDHPSVGKRARGAPYPWLRWALRGLLRSSRAQRGISSGTARKEIPRRFAPRNDISLRLNADILDDSANPRGRYFWLIPPLSRTFPPPPLQHRSRDTRSPAETRRLARRPHQEEMPCPPSPPPRAA